MFAREYKNQIFHFFYMAERTLNMFVLKYRSLIKNHHISTACYNILSNVFVGNDLEDLWYSYIMSVYGYHYEMSREEHIKNNKTLSTPILYINVQKKYLFFCIDKPI